MRAALGRAFSRETAANISSVRFKSNPSETSLATASAVVGSGAVSFEPFGVFEPGQRAGHPMSGGLIIPNSSGLDVTERKDV